MDDRPIGMFDSGVGGLTVMKEVIAGCPDENIVYLGDTKRFPYGSKTKEEIVEYTKAGVGFLIGKGAKAVIIACGTATSQALEEVQKCCQLPIMGIIDETVEYIRNRGYKRIGVIATQGTIRSNGWGSRLSQRIPDATVISRACPLLAPMAEEGWTENEVARLTVREYVKEFKNQVDCLILGCTHYPLFTRFIMEELGDGTEVINTGTVLSGKLDELLMRGHMKNGSGNRGSYELYITGADENFAAIAGRVLKDEQTAGSTKVVDIDLKR